NEVAVENHGFDLSQERVFAIDVAPTHLNHSDLRVTEVIDYILEEIRRRYEIGIENCNQFAVCGLQTVLKCACIKTMAVRTVQMMDVKPKLPVFCDRGRGNRYCAIGGVVQKLDFEKLTRVTNVACSLD